MAAAPTDREITRAKGNTLIRLHKELDAAQVPHTSLSRTSEILGAGPAAGKFRIFFKTVLRASNGETFLNWGLNIVQPPERYELLDVAAGLNRIKALFGNEADKLAETEAAYQLVLVERAIRAPSPAAKSYLHLPDGTRHPQNGGEVYAYNEMRAGKPMLRLGPSNADYVEFQPGMSVRHADGRLVAQIRQ